jgi:hypothetical protein
MARLSNSLDETKKENEKKKTSEKKWEGLQEYRH